METPSQSECRLSFIHWLNELNATFIWTILQVDKCLITQPINFKFDHSYLDQAIDAKRLYGIFLLNPQLSLEEGIDYINSFERKKQIGYVGMRLNPALFPAGESLSGEKGKALYNAAGLAGFPINVMCFTGGVAKYISDLVELINAHPDTKLIIDHMGFFVQEGKISEDSWLKLLSLSMYPQVYVKISALFRLSLQPSAPFQANFFFIFLDHAVTCHLLFPYSCVSYISYASLLFRSGFGWETARALWSLRVRESHVRKWFPLYWTDGRIWVHRWEPESLGEVYVWVSWGRLAQHFWANCIQFIQSGLMTRSDDSLSDI